MSILSWNCRGLGHPRAVRALVSLVNSRKPDIVFLIETKLKSSEWSSIIRKVKLFNILDVECIGRRGGLALLWSRNVNVSVKSFSSHHIEAIINEDLAYSWRLTGFYGHHETSKRHLSWELFRHVDSLSQMPSIFIGDFNETQHVSEQLSSRRLRPSYQINKFNQAITDCGLQDMGFCGHPFTWSNNFFSPFTTRARLDRALVSPDWITLFPDAKLIHGATFHSDHVPLWLQLGNLRLLKNRPKPRFRFEAGWTMYKGSREVVKTKWSETRDSDPGLKVFNGIRNCRLGLLQWKRKELGNIPKKIEDKQEELSIVQQGQISDISKIRATKLINEIDKYHETNDIYWAQRAKAEWYTKGDRNTGFFHALSVQRHKLNLITRLQNQHGDWIIDINQIKNMVVDFYRNLFTSQSNGIIPVVNHLNTPRRLSTYRDEAFTAEEVKKALFSMKGLKSPGPDGMSALFFQNNWETVGDDMIKMTLQCVNEGLILKKANFTLITLIPKIPSPISLNQFRPIALCNVTMKVVGKVIANRLKEFLPNLISTSQSAFVPQRLITDNILQAYEAHHLIKKKKQGVVGYMSIKLDMVKAYDRIEWSFLHVMLIKLGFTEHWIMVIMSYVTSVTYAVLVNGEQTGFIHPGRGLRQGDPLSPYLFILCTEGLIALIQEAIAQGLIHGIRVGSNGPPFTHLLFADDTLLLGVATVQEAAAYKAILQQYEEWSGQLVSVQKSSILFSPNVIQTTRDSISGILGMPETDSHGKYLGLPTVIGASKKIIFSSLIEKMKHRVSDWKPRILSKAGKEVFITSVLQGIPIYAMQCFLLPIQTCKEMHMLMANYWWGDNTDEKKIHWCSWQSIAKPKELGGLGFRDLHLFNQALLCKQAWNLLVDPSTPLARLYKDMYHPDSDFWNASLGRNPSYTWRSIISVKEMMKKGVIWTIGNGKTINIWKSKWLPHTWNHLPITREPHNCSVQFVADLIDENTGRWNTDLVRQTFWSIDVDPILSVCGSFGTHGIK